MTTVAAPYCTCACHQGGATFCATQVPCCAAPEVAHDAAVCCPFCGGLAAQLGAHILECPGCVHLLPSGRRALRAVIAAAHAARR